MMEEDVVTAQVRIYKMRDDTLVIEVGPGRLYVYPDQLFYRDWNQLYEEGKKGHG